MAIFLSEATSLSPLLFHAGDCAARVPYVASCLDLSVQFHRDSREADWLMLEARAPAAAGGLAHVEHRFWAPDGTLLASARASLLCRANRLARRPVS